MLRPVPKKASCARGLLGVVVVTGVLLGVGYHHLYAPHAPLPPLTGGFRAPTGYAFDRAADASGFVLAYPDGYERHWNDCRKAASFSARALGVDDVGIVRAMVGHLQSEFGVDPGNRPSWPIGRPIWRKCGCPRNRSPL